MKLDEIRNVREIVKKHLVLTVSPRIIGYNHRKFVWLWVIPPHLKSGEEEYYVVLQMRRMRKLCNFSGRENSLHAEVLR